MATQDEYKVVSDALLSMIRADINTVTESGMGSVFARLIPPDLAPHLAVEAARLAVDTIDKYRAQHKPVVLEPKTEVQPDPPVLNRRTV